MAKILAVDDDRKILRLLQKTLALHGHQVTVKERATDILTSELEDCDLLLLDVMMPEMDGFTFCSQNRERIPCPILFLTAKTEEEAVIKGLLSGGDDYIKKPFSIHELNARVEAHLRRENRKEQRKRITRDNIVLDLEGHEMTVDGKKLSLTKSQYQICEFLAANPGVVFSKEQIYDTLYTLESDTLISTITEHVRIIRNKFKEMGCSPIETIWGVGYKWK